MAASKLGKTEGALSRWANAVTQPDLDDLVAVSKLTGATVDWLLGLDRQDHGIKPVLSDAALPPHEIERLQRGLAKAEAALQAAREIVQGRKR